MGGTHTDVTGDEAQKVIDAVKAKDSTVTIDKVQKDKDGSYDATGMIRELLHTWATELDLRGEALDVWATAVRAQTETVARTDHRMRLA